MRIALFASSLTSTGRRFQSSRCDGWCVSSRVCLHVTVPSAIRHHLGRTVFDTSCAVKAAIASLLLLPVALALEILPHVRLSRPPVVCPRLTRMHARPMSQIMASSPCTVVWLLSGTLFPSVFSQSVPSAPSRAAGCAITLAFQLGVVFLLSHHSPATFAVISQSQVSVVPAFTISRLPSPRFCLRALLSSPSPQPLTSLPLIVLLSISGARACPASDSALIGGSDALVSTQDQTRRSDGKKCTIF